MYFSRRTEGKEWICEENIGILYYRCREKFGTDTVPRDALIISRVKSI